ncbi:uncharacterized protein BO66DRAFT_219569 [Aspergillus aculeatinus CBS 121060]|uniref:Uncharacterized protein n=1 Tax=Aspergillus aculeatinus CBS 121060 TaxID=1448322 RepID=A0ACD1GUW3_9EURO|nr:hypothetical protein BO66DRAFT_219569 [Aspergillus aculeatinus CBS 121060]RAH65049.1 hypothetical protein BO66DRAFT_219569 [Aspergillus aculeatinus CBS 121060]
MLPLFDSIEFMRHRVLRAEFTLLGSAEQMVGHFRIEDLPNASVDHIPRSSRGRSSVILGMCWCRAQQRSWGQRRLIFHSFFFIAFAFFLVSVPPLFSE